jgi:YidC/Oxa1 family membrane protein insertase
MKKIFFELLNFFIFFLIKNKKIIIYSEGLNYQKYFISLINTLEENNTIIYLSSELNDVIKKKNITNLYIGTGLIRFFIFYFANGENFYLTLTDLQNNELKKSKFIKNYIYVFHSPNSLLRAYTKNAFNNYDTIISIGKKHTEEIRFLEKLNNSPTKKIIERKYFFFEYLEDRLNKKKISFNNKIKSILIAPSWNYQNKNFFTQTCEDLISIILKKGIKVILRPHPEHYKRNSDVIINIKNNFKTFKKFYFDSDPSNFKSLLNSDLLITDYSGISIEYLLVFRKPVIFFDEYVKNHSSYNIDRKKYSLIEDDIKNKFGLSIKNNNLSDFYNISNTYYKNFKKIRKKISVFKNIYFYN